MKCSLFRGALNEHVHVHVCVYWHKQCTLHVLYDVILGPDALDDDFLAVEFEVMKDASDAQHRLVLRVRVTLTPPT